MAADEFSAGLRNKRKIIANRGRPSIVGADYKPEAQTRYKGEDSRLNETIGKLQRALEVVQGARGQVADHGVTFRDLDAELKDFTAEIEHGYLETAAAQDTAGTADANATQALIDAAVAQATADQALSDANEAHSGEVTSPAGSRTMTLDVSAVTNRTNIAAEDADSVIINDDTDGGLKRTTVDSLLDGGYF